MPRVKGGNVARNRRKKILKLAKGYYGSKHTLYRTAHEQVMRSLSYAYRDRKQRKRDFRRLWIARINAAAKMHGTSYSKVMFGLKCANIEINRKMLSELAIHDPKAFESIVNASKKAIENGSKPTIKEKIAKEVTKVKKEVKEEVQEIKDEVKEEVKEIKEKIAEVKAELSDLNTMTVSELKALAKEKGKSGYSALKKNELIELLS